jgi:predicted nuclease with TOPRIM domain
LFKDKSRDLSKQDEYLSFIKNFDIVLIGRKEYSSINNLKFWDFIQRNYTSIKTIHKNSIHELYVAEEMNPIKNEYELDRLQFIKDTLFLSDLSPMFKELSDQKQKLESYLDEQKQIIFTAKSEIKKRLETEFKTEVVELDDKLKSIESKKAKLDNQITMRQNELMNLLGQETTANIELLRLKVNHFKEN